MQGLRTPEDGKFERFFRMVQDAAKKKHSVFFLAAGDGHDLVEDDLEGEDLQGWLIPDEKAEEFEKVFNEYQEGEQWDDFFCFAEWKKDKDEIKIEFNEY